MNHAAPTTAKPPQTEIRALSPQQLARAKPHPLIIDVRDEREYRLGHIEGAKHLSRHRLKENVHEIAPDSATPIVVYCAIGDRGASAAETLQHTGYSNISWLKGGLRNWLEAGGLVEV